MATIVLALSGPIASGKTALAENMATRLGYHHVRIRSLLQGGFGPNEAAATRSDLQDYGAALEVQTAGRWLADRISQLAASEVAEGIVVDSVRTVAQVRRLREQLGAKFVHLHLTATPRILEDRFESRRGTTTKEASTYLAATSHSIEQEEGELLVLADKVIDTSEFDLESVYRVAVSSVGV